MNDEPNVDAPSPQTTVVYEGAEVDNGESELPRPTRWQRLRVPLLLFFLTALSTFFSGATFWPRVLVDLLGTEIIPLDPLFYHWLAARHALLTQWGDGLTYMFAVLAILLAHELGHYIATRIYRVPATLPLFIPMPLSPIGTLGAVILMDSRKADRRTRRVTR
jgi:hypothetical protein